MSEIGKFSQGCNWVVGTTNAAVFPTDGLGGSVGQSGALVGAAFGFGKWWVPVAVIVTTPGAANSVATISNRYNAAGTATDIYTITVPTTAAGVFPVGLDGVAFPPQDLSNPTRYSCPCFALPATAVATLVFKLIG